MDGIIASQLHITGTPDPEKIGELLAKMSPEEIQAMMGKRAELEEKRQGATCEERIARFRRFRSDFYGAMSSGQFPAMATLSQSWDVKTKMTSPDAKSLTAILAQELQVPPRLHPVPADSRYLH